MLDQHPSLTDLIQTALKAGSAKDAILLQIIRANPTVDLVKANELYMTEAKAGGYILSKEEKQAKLANIVIAHTADGVLNREAAVPELMSTLHLKRLSATERLKTYCAANDITMLRAKPPKKRDRAKVDAAYKEWFAQKLPQDQIEAGLCEHFKYTPKGVRLAYGEIGRRLGLIEKASRSNIDAVVAWFKDPSNVEGTKAKVIQRFMDAHDVSAFTADSRYQMYQFALKFNA